MLALVTILAQGEAPKGAPPGFDLLPLLLIGLSFLIFIILPMRRERRQRQEMISAIEKGDDVVVNGAILGTVDRIVKADGREDELVLKVDPNSNVRLRVLRSGITRVIKETAKDSKDGA